MSGDGDRVAGKEGGLRHERHSRRCGTVDSCYTLTKPETKKSVD